MNDLPALSGKLILKLAFICEGALFVIGLAWLGFLGESMPFVYSLRSIVIGIAATIPLFVGNYLLFKVAAPRLKMAVFELFFNEIIAPLCAALSVAQAIVVGILSGLGEELFFRGALTSFLTRNLPLGPAVFLASFIFAYVHFVGSARRFLPVLLVYWLFGLYFSAIVLKTGNLVPAMVAHALYNSVAIIYINRLSRNRPELS